MALDAALAAGLLRWHRYLALGPGQDQEELIAAVGLLAPVYRAQPDLVADQTRALLSAVSSTWVDRQRTGDRYEVRLLENALRAGRDIDADEAMDLLRQLLSASDDGTAEHVRRVASFSYALRVRVERAVALADPDQAIDMIREALTASIDDDPGRAAMWSRSSVPPSPPGSGGLTRWPTWMRRSP